MNGISRPVFLASIRRFPAVWTKRGRNPRATRHHQHRGSWPNYYKRGITKADPTTIIERATRVDNPRAVYTDVGWEVYSPGLTDTLVWIKDRYGSIPIYITENGAAFYDPPCVNGSLEDPLRVDYLKQHIRRAAGDVRRRPPRLHGLVSPRQLRMALGYSKRFGIIHVDFETQSGRSRRAGRCTQRSRTAAGFCNATGRRRYTAAATASTAAS